MSRLSEKTIKKIREEFKKNGSIRATAKLVGVNRNAIRREVRGKIKTGAQVRAVSRQAVTE